VACFVALVWAILQSKREGEQVGDAPGATAPIKGRA
jgi:hypothetical protein